MNETVARIEEVCNVENKLVDKPLGNLLIQGRIDLFNTDTLEPQFEMSTHLGSTSTDQGSIDPVQNDLDYLKPFTNPKLNELGLVGL